MIGRNSRYIDKMILIRNWQWFNICLIDGLDSSIDLKSVVNRTTDVLCFLLLRPFQLYNIGT